MADERSQSDVSSFFSRLRGDDKIRKSDSLIVLNTPQSTRERQVKQKISSIVQYVKNKTWSRRHVEFFEEYRRMTATFPIIKAGIDIYGEEIVAKNSDGKIFTIKSDNKKVKDMLEECFFKNLALNAKGFRIAREMCKFGNTYGYLITRPKDGVTDIVFLPPEAIIREQMYDPSNLENFRFTWYGTGGGAVFEPWEVVHWKNGEDIEMEPYGSSILRPIVDTWRRVVLIREALVIYRITRAPSKLLFKIGTDGMTGEEAFRFAQEMKKEVQKKPLTNPQTGEIDFKYNPMPVHKDTPIPLLDGRILTIEQLSDEYKEGKENFVYSVQDNTKQIVAGKVKWCGKNYTTNKLIRVWLDNESYLDTAPEHPFVLRNGTSKRADELVNGDSLMPFYQDTKVLYKTTNYHRTYNPATGSYEFTHHLVSRELANLENYKTRHHKDFNRYNNNPTNLQWVDFEEHKKMHKALTKAMWENEDRKKEISTKISTTIKEKLKKGDYITRDKNSSLKMKEWWASEVNRSLKQISERERMNTFYLSSEGEIRRKKVSEAFKKINTEKWSVLNRDTQLKSMSKCCDSFTWEQIFTFIKNNNPDIKTTLEFINSNLTSHLNNINKRDCSNITVNWLNKRIHENGYKSFTELKKNEYKNHKVFKVELLENVSEDVYCMTVVGLNNEDDRHNFATLGLNSDKSINESGVFVKNSIEENFFVPVYEGSPSDVTVLDGAGNLDAVEDYKIIKDDLFAGMKIPKSWLTFEEDLSNKSALGEEDVRFAKTIQRLQSEFVEGLLHIGIVHLFLKGCSQEEMESFTIEMNNPSIASEKKKLELVQARIDIAKSAWDYNNPGLNLMSYVDVLKSILKFSDAEIEATIKSQFNEKKIAWRLEQLRTNGTYEEPDLEKRIAQMRGLTGQVDGKTPDSFSNLSFEGDSLMEVMKKKIDEEIKEIVGAPISGKPNPKMVRQLTENSDLMKNLKKSRKDFGLPEKDPI